MCKDLNMEGIVCDCKSGYWLETSSNKCNPCSNSKCKVCIDSSEKCGIQILINSTK